MNCKHCKAQWTAPKDKSLSKCPFCNEPLIDPTQVGNNASPDIILLQVVEQFDVDILGDRRLSAILSDFMPHVERRYLNIFRQAVQEGIGARLLELTNEDEAIRTATIHTLKSSFRQNNGFDHTADYVVDCFLFALGWAYSAQEQNPETTVMANGKSILKVQLEQAVSDDYLSKDEINMLFGLGSSLGITDMEIATMINEAIKQKGLKPATPVDSKIKNPKDKLTACDWSLGSKSTNEQNFTETTDNLNLEMIFVEGGTFTMGATPEQEPGKFDCSKPAHDITLDSFYIGKYPVTQQQWEAIMGENPSQFKSKNKPVEMVSWDDIQPFLYKLNKRTGRNYRLPTEAEWEYAARGGQNSRGYKYSGSDKLSDVGWFEGNSDETQPVGKKKPNELGIHDMSGNVWEWCQDWYEIDYYKSSPRYNPQGPSNGSKRVCRGGSWYFIAGNCRVSNRLGESPDYCSKKLGFRLVLAP